MITETILTRLASVWKGPAVLVKLDDTTITLGQGTPETTVTIKNPAVLTEIAADTSLGFGEAYMRGDIVVEGDIVNLLEGFYKTGKSVHTSVSVKAGQKLAKLVTKRVSKDDAIHNARHHYDVGNDFYKLWLDRSLAYTCAYFANEDDDLETAQKQKFDLVCRKARLQPGQKVIDLGCGWGGLIFHAAEHYGVEATGVVAAKEQATYIEEEAKRRGLSDKIRVQCSDWRDATGVYDRVLSVGMLEHVGFAQYTEFFGLVNNLLNATGIAFIHSIGVMKPDTVRDSWIEKYIFPGYFVPAPEEMIHYATQAGMHVVDLENIWQHYTKTLDHWSANYDAHRAEIIDMYDEQFDRMWWLYLRASMCAFKWGGLNLWQVVMLKDKQVSWPLQREVGVGKNQ
jgi:cyclopropane-fatty-acyl-phospholipid synthase